MLDVDQLNQIKQLVLEKDYVIVDGTESNNFLLDFYPFPRKKGEVLRLLLLPSDIYITMIRKNKFIEIQKSQKYAYEKKDWQYANFEKMSEFKEKEIDKFDNIVAVIIDKKIKKKDYNFLLIGAYDNEDKSRVLDKFLTVIDKQVDERIKEAGDDIDILQNRVTDIFTPEIGNKIRTKKH